MDIIRFMVKTFNIWDCSRAVQCLGMRTLHAFAFKFMHITVYIHPCVLSVCAVHTHSLIHSLTHMLPHASKMWTANVRWRGSSMIYALVWSFIIIIIIMIGILGDHYSQPPFPVHPTHSHTHCGIWFIFNGFAPKCNRFHMCVVRLWVAVCKCV